MAIEKAPCVLVGKVAPSKVQPREREREERGERERKSQTNRLADCLTGSETGKEIDRERERERERENTHTHTKNGLEHNQESVDTETETETQRQREKGARGSTARHGTFFAMQALAIHLTDSTTPASMPLASAKTNTSLPSANYPTPHPIPPNYIIRHKNKRTIAISLLSRKL